MTGKSRSYLRRLDGSAYGGLNIVHWTHTVDRRATGWLDDRFHRRFREVMTHACFVYRLWCPGYCLMLDHIHLIWMGTAGSSVQGKATKWFRRQVNALLNERGVAFQRQAHDRVLRPEDRKRFAFEDLVRYVLDNPSRAGLIDRESGSGQWPYRGAVLPGYPDFSERAPFSDETWDLFWKLYYHAVGEGTSSQD
ncbi:MAG: hypothetical protein WD342_02865 [Verrucomicrobiales bacterium]